MFMELLMFMPFAFTDIFLVRVEHGYSKATLKSALINRFIPPMQMVLLMYVPVILFTTRVVEWQQDRLLPAIVIGTALVKFCLLYLYPSVISPLFHRKVPFPQDAENKALFEKIVKMAEDNGYLNARRRIFMSESVSNDLHSNASVSSRGINLSKQLLDHHKDHNEILAILMHELTHWKEMHLFWFIGPDMLYMTLFALFLGPQLNNPTFLSSFGFR